MMQQTDIAAKTKRISPGKKLFPGMIMQYSKPKTLKTKTI